MDLKWHTRPFMQNPPPPYTSSRPPLPGLTKEGHIDPWAIKVAKVKSISYAQMPEAKDTFAKAHLFPHAPDMRDLTVHRIDLITNADYSTGGYESMQRCHVIGRSAGNPANAAAQAAVYQSGLYRIVLQRREEQGDVTGWADPVTQRLGEGFRSEDEAPQACLFVARKILRYQDNLVLMTTSVHAAYDRGDIHLLVPASRVATMLRAACSNLKLIWLTLEPSHRHLCSTGKSLDNPATPDASSCLPRKRNNIIR